MLTLLFAHWPVSTVKVQRVLLCLSIHTRPNTSQARDTKLEKLLIIVKTTVGVMKLHFFYQKKYIVLKLQLFFSVNRGC